MKRSKIVLIIICFIGYAFCFLLILQTPAPNQPKPPTQTTAPYTHEPAKQPDIQFGLPVRLRIPKINIDAAIEHVGLTSKGDMQAPTKLQNAGWFKLGPRPGNKGSAVVAGHFGLSGKDASVFNNLHTLSQGDLVHIEDEKGTIASFIVRELKTYNKDTAAPEVFSSSDKKAHLNLITCKGTWQRTQQTYSERLVVFADSK